jgi:hypothetical protein
MMIAMKYYIAVLFFFGVLFGSTASANAFVEPLYTLTDKPKDVVIEMQINKDGLVDVHGAKIVQILGTTLQTRIIFGDTFLRMIVKMNSKSKLVRKYGEIMPFSDLKVGDYIDVMGGIETSGDTFAITASTTRNLLDYTQKNEFFGSFMSFSTSSDSFYLNTASQGVVTVVIGTTTQLLKGTRLMSPYYLRPGDFITSVTGIYNFKNKNLISDIIKVPIDMTQFKPRNFEGVIDQMTSTVLPTTFIATIEGKRFELVLSDKTSVLNNKRQSTSLKRFVVGDKIRVYGGLRETDTPIVDVEVVRNISL